MIRNFICLFVLFVALPGQSFSFEDLAEKETKKLQGNWEIVSEEVDGKATPKQDFKNIRVSIKGDVYRTEVDGKTTAQGTWKFVKTEGKTVAVDEVTESTDPAVNGTTPAIYEWVNENSFRWCQHIDKGKRPTEFTAKKGSRQSIVEYRRIKR